MRAFHQHGAILIELLIAFGIFTLVLSSVVILSFGFQRTAVADDSVDRAIALAREDIEATVAVGGSSFTTIVPASHSADEYLHERFVYDEDEFTKQVTCRVSWQSGWQTRDVSLKTIVTDYRRALTQGSCGAVSGDWHNPGIIASVALDVGNEGTDVEVAGDRLYVTADSAAASAPDVYVMDVSVPVAAHPIGTLNTGPGLAAVVIAGHYAYVANMSITAQLQVLDIRDPVPVLVASLKMPTAIGTGGQAVGKSIFYADGRVFIGLVKTGSGPEFNVVDVTDPVHPAWLGGWQTGTTVNAIHVIGRYAYLATPANEELTVVDITDPAHITRVGGYDAPGASGSGKSLYRVGSTLYLGRTIGGAELHALDIVGAPTISPLFSKDLNTSINGLIVRNGIGFLATIDATREIQLWDTANLTSVYGSVNLPTRANTLTCARNALFVPLGNGDHRLIIVGPGP